LTNYYKLLGLPTYASIADVKEAYKLKIKQFHPDISCEPDAEEMTKYLNLAKESLDTPEAKNAYDRKLKLAYLKEIERLTESRSTPKKRSKQYIKERIRRSKEARKWKIKNRYEKNLEYLPKKFRMPCCILLILWGLQIIYSHYFVYFGTMDRTFIALGIGLFFTGICFGANEAYTNYIIQSIHKKVPHNFEQKIGMTLVLGFALGLTAVIGLNEFRAHYHLKNNYAYSVATIDYKASLNGGTVVRYEVNKKVYYKRLSIDVTSILRFSNNQTVIKYATVDPLIVKHMTKEEVQSSPLGPN